jgi:hypothetical protein
VKADPHEINKDTKDFGLVFELELRERMRPGGVWQRVATPTLSQMAAGDKVKVRVACATEGASIAYTTDSGVKPHWLL